MADRDQNEDLLGVDLSAIDLDDIELDEEQPSKAGRWLAGLVFLGLMVLVLWLPTTGWYLQYGHTNWFFFAMCGAAAIVGLFGGRWLWNWAQEAAARYQARRRVEPEEPPKPPSALQRWMTLLVALGGGGLLIFWLPDSGHISGATSGGWFLGAVGAVVVGILLGRWLLMQPPPDAERREVRPIVLPPWFKWVTLTVLAGGAVLILGASLFYGDNIPESVEFSMGGGALVLGVGAAIWLVRRFDETERKIKEQVRARRGPSTEA